MLQLLCKGSKTNFNGYDFIKDLKVKLKYNCLMVALSIRLSFRTKLSEILKSKHSKQICIRTFYYPIGEDLMGTYLHNHTSDLSASLSCSSVAESVSVTDTVVENTTSFDSDGSSDQNSQPIGSDVKTLIIRLFASGKYDVIIDISSELLKLHPESIFLHNVLGESYAKLGENLKAISHFEHVLAIKPEKIEENLKTSYAPNVYNNLGVLLKSMGFLEESEKNLVRSIELNPKLSSAYNNYGNLLNDKAELMKAQECFLKAIDIEPDNFVAYWNLHSTVSEAHKAKAIIEQCLTHSPLFRDAIYTLAGMNAFNGNDKHFRDLMSSGLANEPILRSIHWILSLPKLPEIHYNRWSIFDRAAELSDSSRPVYEYGVWMGESFKYLMKHFKKGYGFDSFEGLPEDWRTVPKGAYSSFGKVPQIDGGEFIIGEFAESLPRFFSKARPMAGLINFDADLYASTLCALVNSKKVMDSKTILVFDEFIVNSDWEKDEFRALNEFCEMCGFSYEVLAISLYTKQVVVRLLNS